DFTEKVNTIYESSPITEADFNSKVKMEIDKLENTTITFTDQFNEKTSSKINVTGNFPKYKILSEGTVGKKTRTVETDFKIKWIEKDTGSLLPQLPDGVGVVADTKVLMNYVTFNGSMYINALANRSVNINGDYKNSKFYHLGNGTIFEGSYYSANKTNFEKVSTQFDISNYKKAINTIKNDVESRRKSGPELVFSPTNRELKINDKDNYKSITTGNGTFAFNTGGQDVTLFVNTLNLTSDNGTLDITGGGRLTVVVKDELLVNKGNINPTGTSDKLNIVYLGDKQLYMGADGSLKFAGNIIITNANADFIGQNMTHTGILLGAKDVTFNNGAGSNGLVIAPNGKVSYVGGYNLSGAVVSSEFEMSNGASFTYEKIDTSNFWNSGSSQGDTGTGDLIITSPIIEPN
uniref:hypothetical protein n=1 Tax=Jeotgalibaca porci TaxID=1868793 RepID=UPI0035A11E69